jgi:hypothetical protein
MRYKMLVLANAVEGKDEEFNRWYDEQHLGDVKALPGVMSGERFKIAGPADKWSYLTLYDVETDDLAAFGAEIERRIGTELMPSTDAIDVETVFHAMFIPISQD